MPTSPAGLVPAIIAVGIVAVLATIGSVFIYTSGQEVPPIGGFTGTTRRWTRADHGKTLK